MVDKLTKCLLWYTRHWQSTCQIGFATILKQNIPGPQLQTIIPVFVACNDLSPSFLSHRKHIWIIPKMILLEQWLECQVQIQCA